MAQLPLIKAVDNAVNLMQTRWKSLLDTLLQNAILNPPGGKSGQVLTYNSNNVAPTWQALPPVSTGVVGVGYINMFGGSTLPTNTLWCDGSSYLISAYPKLAAALFDSTTGLYAYGSADSYHFNVPDLRGLFPRGTNTMGVGASGNDPDAAARTVANPNGNTGDNVGSSQADEIVSHAHNTYYGVSGGGPYVNNFYGSNGNYGQVGTITNTGGNETRPKNVYVNFVIQAL